MKPGSLTGSRGELCLKAGKNKWFAPHATGTGERPLTASGLSPEIPWKAGKGT